MHLSLRALNTYSDDTGARDAPECETKSERDADD
jgi:hypothetical protein